MFESHTLSICKTITGSELLGFCVLPIFPWTAAFLHQRWHLGACLRNHVAFPSAHLNSVVLSTPPHASIQHSAGSYVKRFNGGMYKPVLRGEKIVNFNFSSHWSTTAQGWSAHSHLPSTLDNAQQLNTRSMAQLLNTGSFVESLPGVSGLLVVFNRMVQLIILMKVLATN
ncbi:uncharacterized protein LOC144825245 [Lissotriton helveticus]